MAFKIRTQKAPVTWLVSTNQTASIYELAADERNALRFPTYKQADQYLRDMGAAAIDKFVVVDVDAACCALTSEETALASYCVGVLLQEAGGVVRATPGIFEEQLARLNEKMEACYVHPATCEDTYVIQLRDTSSGHDKWRDVQGPYLFLHGQGGALEAKRDRWHKHPIHEVTRIIKRTVSYSVVPEL